MKTFNFVVYLSGEGETAEEAWQDATDAFAGDPGEPESYTMEETEDDAGITLNDMIDAYKY